MRVRGNRSPSVLTIETYHPLPGYVEVRLRENINEISETDEITGETATLFEYDEYTFHLEERLGLREEIEKNMSDWLATGRVMEVNFGASIVQDMTLALTVMGVSE